MPASNLFTYCRHMPISWLNILWLDNVTSIVAGLGYRFLYNHKFVTLIALRQQQQIIGPFFHAPFPSEGNQEVVLRCRRVCGRGR